MEEKWKILFQKLEEEQRRVAEQELKLKEMRDNLLKEEEERLLRERKIRERELELQRQQVIFIAKNASCL